jgi:hypothetical protein
MFKDPMQQCSDQKLAIERKKAAEKIDWVPHGIKDLVAEHQPDYEANITNGVINKEQLKAKSSTLFKKLKAERHFTNAYQVQQIVNLFGGYWGFHVTIQGYKLKCFYGKSTSKFCKSTVSPGKQQQHMSIKNGCGFHINLAPQGCQGEHHRTAL